MKEGGRGGKGEGGEGERSDGKREEWGREERKSERKWRREGLVQIAPCVEWVSGHDYWIVVDSHSREQTRSGHVLSAHLKPYEYG